MATNFSNRISNGVATLNNRAEIIETQAKAANNAILDNLKNRKTKIQLEIENLLDFSPESTQSLRPGKSDWNAEAWARSLNNLKLELTAIEDQLKVAQSIQDDLFTEIA